MLATGTKHGYVFEIRASPSTPEFLWMGVANLIKKPAPYFEFLRRRQDKRCFATNHEGVTYYTTAGPVPINPECEIPAGMRPVGK